MQYKEIKLKGLASNSIRTLSIEAQQLNLTLLNFLISHEIPMASSCSGKGACERCKVNGETLSCALTVKEFLDQISDTIEVDYL